MAMTGLRSWLSTLVREFAKIPHYNSEGERLLRAMRNGHKAPPDEVGVRAVGRIQDRDNRKRSVALGVWPLVARSQGRRGGQRALDDQI